jgi:hypothetical protein
MGFEDKGDIQFYDTMKENFLMTLSMYLGDLRLKNSQMEDVREQNRVL